LDAKTFKLTFILAAVHIETSFKYKQLPLSSEKK